MIKITDLCHILKCDNLHSWGVSVKGKTILFFAKFSLVLEFPTVPDVLNVASDQS